MSSFWMIEHPTERPHRWLRIVDDSKWGCIRAMLTWHEIPALCIQFARRDDAVLFQKLHIDWCALSIVTEHGWVSSANGEDRNGK